MDTLACIKRVPDTGARIVLTDDKQSIDDSHLGHTVSPHEECAVEEAVSLAEATGGSATALTLGEPAADEQLRRAIAMGVDHGILLTIEEDDWAARETANAIASAVADDEGEPAYDLLLFGNESADAQNYQVGIRVADALGVPAVTGIKDLEIEDDRAIAKREVPGGAEVFEVDLPAVIAVKEGLNTPRYPSMQSQMRARRVELDERAPEPVGYEDVAMIEFEVPERDDSPAEILGEDASAAPAVVDVLEELEVL